MTVTGKSKLFFQDATDTQCGQTMYDNRGTDAYKNIAYTTAKIGGLCWMTRNLDLPGGTTLTPADSNVSSDYTLPASSTSGFSNNSTAYVYNSGSTTCGEDSPCYSYYSYAAATAGTNPDSGNATSDICPKGWRLPTQAEYNTLVSTYTTGDALTASPWYGVYAGIYDDGSFGVGGSVGTYWSSTADNSAYAYLLLFYSSNAHVFNDAKWSGYSVRCVKIPAMQDVTSSQLSTMMPNDGDTTILKDNRDGKSYTIGKINDKYWMTQNLDLPGGTTLTPADSNVSSDYTLPDSDTRGFSGTAASVYNTGSTTCGDNSPCYSYYSYKAATAGTNPGSGNATSDICPKGWRLPTRAEVTALKSTYPTGADVTASPWNGVYGGSYSGGSFYDGGTYGNYWSSTAYSSTSAYSMSFGRSSLGAGMVSKGVGCLVRCVAK